MAAIGNVVLYHLDAGRDRPAIVLNVNGDTTCDLHVFVDPATDNTDWAIDPTVNQKLIVVVRSVVNGAGIGQFT